MDPEQCFLQVIRDAPDDEGLRLIYADWLEERDDPRGEFLRLDCALPHLAKEDPSYTGAEARWNELRAAIDPAWLAALTPPAIENCSFPFKYRCPKQWGQLQKTADESVRFCQCCRRSVFFCGTIDQARFQARLGHCIAIDSHVERSPGDLEPEGHGDTAWIGEPGPEEEWERALTVGLLDGPSPSPRRSASFTDRVSNLVRSILTRVGLAGREGDFWALARPGQRVRVTSGTFEGYLGEIETLDPVRRRATVNLPVFSGQLPVELDVNELELAETNGPEQSSAGQSSMRPG
jgi:uncharacterized protein (TIGR02996 family)